MVADRKEDQTCAAKCLIYGAPGGIRTPNPQIRSLMLCPVELQAPWLCRLLKINNFESFFKKESLQPCRNLAIGQEHGFFCQLKSPRFDHESVLGRA
jgi:hypothetical protein